MTMRKIKSNIENKNTQNKVEVVHPRWTWKRIIEPQRLFWLLFIEPRRFLLRLLSTCPDFQRELMLVGKLTWNHKHQQDEPSPIPGYRWLSSSYPLMYTLHTMPTEWYIYELGNDRCEPLPLDCRQHQHKCRAKTKISVTLIANNNLYHPPCRLKSGDILVATTLLHNTD